MRVLISAEGDHDPAGHHLMMVDGYQTLIDLTYVRGTLHDPAIRKVDWGPTVHGGQVKDGGQITRVDGGVQPFWDRALLEPYLDAFSRRKRHLERTQAAHIAATLASTSTPFAGADTNPDEAFGPKVG